MGSFPANDDAFELRKVLEDAVAMVKSGSMPCIIARRRGLRTKNPGQVFHEYPELFIQYRGTNRFTMPSEQLDLHKNQILVIPPGLPHGELAIPDEEGFAHLVITAEDTFLQCHISEARALSQGNRLVPVIRHFERNNNIPPTEIHSLFSALTEAGSHQDNYRQTIVSGLLLALLASTQRIIEASPEISDEHPLLEEIRRMVMSRYHFSDLSVKSLAAQVKKSPDYLSWLFHQESGITLSRYISQVRLNRAVNMLRGTDYNVSEIAWSCGFTSPAYFSRVFSERFGRSPRDFRAHISRPSR